MLFFLSLTHRLDVPRGHEVAADALLLLHPEGKAQILRSVELQVILVAVLPSFDIQPCCLFS